MQAAENTRALNALDLPSHHAIKHSNQDKTKSRIQREKCHLDLLPTALRGHAQPHVFPRRTVILTEGEDTNLVYLITSGNVKISIHGEQGNELILDILGPGSFLGEINLFGMHRIQTSATAMHTTKVLQIPRKEVETLALSNPEFTSEILRRVTTQVRQLTERLSDFALSNVYQRVAKVLVNSATQTANHWVINPIPSQQHIAGLVGASQAMVSKILKELCIGGYICIHPDQITIHKKLPKSW